MQVDFFKPSHPVLQNYIDYFYFLERSETDQETTYLGFPTTSTYVMVCKNSDFIINNQNISILSSQRSNLRSVLFSDTKISGEMHYKGATNEITISFKPLGINVFLEKNFSEYRKNVISIFEFEPNFNAEFSCMFDIKSNAERVVALEKYFLSILKKEVHPVLKRILSDIHNPNYNFPTVNDLCLKYSISRPTLNYYFKSHLGTNPRQYIRIVRFRNAIKQFTSDSSRENLSNLTYLTDYFDQSHMIKDFVSLTGFTPKKFFNKITQFEDGQINWLFL